MSVYEELLLADGDELVAVGRVVADERGTWLDPPLPVALPYYPDGGPVLRATDFAVPLVGANLGQLPDRQERDGLVEGYAQVRGMWHHGTLACTSIGPVPTPAPGPGRRWRTPPCPDPPGGWPAPGPTGNLPVPSDTARPDANIVSMAVFRPSERTVAAVVSATDTAAAERALRPQLGRALCVVKARWSRAEVDAVRGSLNTAMPELGAYQTGETVSAAGQPLLTMSVVRVTVELLALLDQVPADLLELDVWLRPGGNRTAGPGQP